MVKTTAAPKQHKCPSHIDDPPKIVGKLLWTDTTTFNFLVGLFWFKINTALQKQGNYSNSQTWWR